MLPDTVVGRIPIPARVSPRRWRPWWSPAARRFGVFRESVEPETALVSVMESGFAGVNAALAGTPFV
jgi:hypothetical protein